MEIKNKFGIQKLVQVIRFIMQLIEITLKILNFNNIK